MKKIKRNVFIYWLFALSCVFLSSCMGGDKVLLKEEYMKEIIIRKQSFDDILDNFLDQVDTYNGTDYSKQRLDEKGEEVIEFINTLENDLKDRVPSECKEHYQNMMKAYSTYLEGINLYIETLPKELSEERNEAIRSAEQKLHDAKEAMLNL